MYLILGRSTAKVWKNFKLVFDLKGHERSVWAVLALGGDQYLTGVPTKLLIPRLAILIELRIRGQNDQAMAAEQMPAHSHRAH